MSLEPVKYFASALVSASLVIAPLPAEAGMMGGISHTRSYTPVTNCKTRPPSPPAYNHNVNIYKPVTINKNIAINKNLNVNNNININKNLNVDNNININKNIDDSKNININKNINDNKNININKNIVINNGGSADASAIASAIAEASANSSASASVNFLGGASAMGGGAIYLGGSGIPESPGPFAGGDLGAIAVSVAEHPQQCVYQDSTVVKAIHAVCVSANGHEFPASHMVSETWIDSSYEGEVARCIPGARLKVIIGEVVQSSQGMATSYSDGQILKCGPHEAVRHYKDGLLKCAPEVPVPDCTERTNLRKYGTGDMFFTYRAKVCVQTHQEYPEKESREIPGHPPHKASSAQAYEDRPTDN
jgi:hypothetical protein